MANLTHEEAIKKQKNREAAKKHREKKEKTLIALKKENEMLEARNEEYTEMQRKLKELIAQAEKLIQHHKEAGCSLPEELRDWKSLTDQSLQNNPTPMEQNSSDSCTSSGASPAMQADPALDKGQRDPMAIFSGESLPSTTQIRPRTQQRVRHYSVLSLEKQPLAKSYINSQLLLAHSTPSFPRSAPTMDHGLSQATAQPAQDAQSPTSINLNPQNHQIITFKAALHSDSPNGSSSGSSTLHQNRRQTLTTNFFQVNGNSCKLIYRDGKYHVIDRPLSSPNMDTSGENSPLNPENPNSTTSAFYQTDRAADASQAYSLSGNIPSAELLEGFDRSTHESNASESINQNVNDSVTELSHGSWLEEEQPQNEVNIATAESTFPQQETLYHGYSYTDDLNLSEPPQHILRTIQSHNFQHQNREGMQGIGSVANADSNTFSDSSTRTVDVYLPQHYSLARGSNLTPHPVTSCPRQDDKTDERATRSVKTPVACAPAILDMLSESEVLPSLQEEIKESLSM
ncbi:hypothetical protein ElyMa_003826100 [Elysia marginata]|uniref:BZIP domain-containing protein n=1 Tax=Elysia marginata TaxID=1093978 RepID=A0AAV4FEU0_9GAST|nr:hypothetical protein ElyMa_003826100 [Elysia marginata]